MCLPGCSRHDGKLLAVPYVFGLPIRDVTFLSLFYTVSYHQRVCTAVQGMCRDQTQQLVPWIRHSGNLCAAASWTADSAWTLTQDSQG